ncbi:MAG TPA: ThuA domain-containing protein [Burkholderiaceae bacterium]|nr:ThuA domain-containing protein [Burkholderiaceae bacterium]
MVVRVTVWGENVHDRQHPVVARIYPRGMHGCIAEGLNADPEIRARCATLDMPEHGLAASVLDETDVLTWWGHKAHDQVDERIVDRVQQRVLEGMGLIVLHSGHHARIFRRLMGHNCNLVWREAGEKERVWVCNPGHAIAQGLPPWFDIPHEEMYGEPFGIPNPDEVVFLSWFAGGEAFRSGVTFRRGAGRIFYFRPGHETYPTYHQAEVQRVLRNAAKWARPEGRISWPCPNRPAEQAPERLAVVPGAPS